jgi:hypothetical protein
MSKNRFFNIFISIALVIVVALTVREAYATSILTSQAEFVQHTSSKECSSLPSRYSIHTEALKATGTRLTFTENGPTGIDGGLMDLMSNYRTCSR